MIYRTFRAPTYKEAVVNAKMELGSDVYILGRKEVKDGGFLGLFAKTYTEITVARNEEKQPAGKKAAGGAPRVQESPREMLSKLQNARQGRPAPNDKAGENPEEDSMAPVQESVLLAEIRDIKDQLKQVMNAGPARGRGGQNSHLEKLLFTLRQKDFSAEYVEEVRRKFESELTLEEVKTPDVLREALRTHILDGFETAGPLEIENGNPQVVVIVGPTGVGKTTTIAKLAASFGVLQKRNVELVTIDSYRIAAVEQLGKYAELMQIPFTAVATRDEFKASVSGSKAELILVDTVGRSQRNNMGLAELRSILDGVKSKMDIHLVMSATTKWRDAVDITTRFDQLGYGKIIISKLDETHTIGSIVSVLNPERKVSYLTNGQGVPDDIEIAQKEKIFSMLELDEEAQGGI
jgi:flagellar biosynthesis protein FlhF